MIIEETFTIDAPIQKVWDFFLDIERMSACMPGVESVRQTDPTAYEGAVKVKVGPIAAVFAGVVEVIEQRAPSYLKAQGRAKDRSTASMVQGQFASRLVALAPRRTEVAYTIDIVIRGKLGQFGQAVIQDTARRLSAIFVERVRAQLEVPEDPAARPEGGQSQTDAAAQSAAYAEVNVAAIAATALLAALGHALMAPFRALARLLRRDRTAPTKEIGHVESRPQPDRDQRDAPHRDRRP